MWRMCLRLYVYNKCESTTLASDFVHPLLLSLSLSLSLSPAVSTVGFSETRSVFHYQWKKWGEELKKVSPISINTQVLVENESKRLK